MTISEWLCCRVMTIYEDETQPACGHPDDLPSNIMDYLHEMDTSAQAIIQYKPVHAIPVRSLGKGDTFSKASPAREPVLDVSQGRVDDGGGRGAEHVSRCDSIS
jgi:hypothetical protein